MIERRHKPLASYRAMQHDVAATEVAEARSIDAAPARAQSTVKSAEKPGEPVRSRLSSGGRVCAIIASLVQR